MCCSSFSRSKYLPLRYRYMLRAPLAHRAAPTNHCSMALLLLRKVPLGRAVLAHFVPLRVAARRLPHVAKGLAVGPLPTEIRERFPPRHVGGAAAWAFHDLEVQERRSVVLAVAHVTLVEVARIHCGLLIRHAAPAYHRLSRSAPSLRSSDECSCALSAPLSALPLFRCVERVQNWGRASRLFPACWLLLAARLSGETPPLPLEERDVRAVLPDPLNFSGHLTLGRRVSGRCQPLGGWP